MFTNGPGDRGSIPGRVIPKTLKMLLDTSLLNTQQYKVLSRVKWSNPGKGVVPPLHPRVITIEKVAFWLPSTTVANFTLLLSLEFFTSALADGFFYLSLSDSKSPQVSRTLLSILAVLLFFFLLLFHFWEFFTPALADVFLMEFEWQEVSLSLQDSS